MAYIFGGFFPKRLTILQKKAVRILARRPYISQYYLYLKNLKIIKLKDQYSIQLYKLYHNNTNNFLPSYFNSFTPYYNNDEHTPYLKSAALHLPMTKREYFVQSTKYQFLKLIRETSMIDLNRTINTTVFQFATYFKYSILNKYDLRCRIVIAMFVDDILKFIFLLKLVLSITIYLLISMVNLETLLTSQAAGL